MRAHTEGIASDTGVHNARTTRVQIGHIASARAGGRANAIANGRANANARANAGAKSERTIERDRTATRKVNAIAPDAHLGDELMGELHSIVLASVQRLTRIATDTDAPHYARVWAETAIVKSYLQLIDKTKQFDYIGSGSDRLRDAVNDDVQTLARELKRSRRRDEQLANPFGETKRLQRDYEAAKRAARDAAPEA